MGLPKAVTREEWRAARAELLDLEKAATRARDALDARRRELPMVEVDKTYLFEGADGKAELLDLFEGRAQLVIYHFVFAPEWEAGCRGCSEFLDQIGHLAHLRARGTAFAAVSRAPFTKILPFKARMGWTVPWYSSHLNDFDQDFGATAESGAGPGERPALSCFLRDGERVFHTYAASGRGLDHIGFTPNLLDLTVLGRQEDGARIEYHDEYDV
ncbi:DUF899 domain-containing protein [Streptomyces sp. NPDC046939]|uniref:DUF899 domain-containing protein n=1 Tax=Streptomyces sp. NPDC046939 TaxID=3155376 RepID=UPI0033E92E89